MNRNREGKIVKSTIEVRAITAALLPALALLASCSRLDLPVGPLLDDRRLQGEITPTPTAPTTPRRSYSLVAGGVGVRTRRAGATTSARPAPLGRRLLACCGAGSWTSPGPSILGTVRRVLSACCPAATTWTVEATADSGGSPLGRRHHPARRRPNRRNRTFAIRARPLSLAMGRSATTGWASLLPDQRRHDDVQAHLADPAQPGVRLFIAEARAGRTDRRSYMSTVAGASTSTPSRRPTVFWVVGESARCTSNAVQVHRTPTIERRAANRADINRRAGSTAGRGQTRSWSVPLGGGLLQDSRRNEGTVPIRAEGRGQGRNTGSGESCARRRRTRGSVVPASRRVALRRQLRHDGRRLPLPLGP